jgi:hypothetical protein
MYKFYMEMEFTSAKEAENKYTVLWIHRRPPFHSTDAVIQDPKGKQDCVPVFSWSFIGSTRGFERSMMENVSSIHSTRRRGICTAFHDCVPSISEEDLIRRR